MTHRQNPELLFLFAELCGITQAVARTAGSISHPVTRMVGSTAGTIPQQT